MKLPWKLESLKRRLTRPAYEGFLLNINESSWDKIDKRARTAVRKAVKNGVTIEESRDLKILRRLWPVHRLHTLPKHELAKYQKMFVAMHDGSPVGAIVLEEAKPVLRYKYAASSREGRNLQANNLLLWKAVEHYMDKGFKYLILGWCSDDGIQSFKESFATQYLIIPQEFWSFLDKTEPHRVIMIFEREPNE